jgi:heme/copper-type cytochrome/quinol oxidase subunit 4
MLHFFAVATIVAVAILTMASFVLMTVKPAYQQVVLRCVYGVTVIVIIVLAAYWLLKTPTATSIS